MEGKEGLFNKWHRDKWIFGVFLIKLDPPLHTGLDLFEMAEV